MFEIAFYQIQYKLFLYKWYIVRKMFWKQNRIICKPL